MPKQQPKVYIVLSRTSWDVEEHPSIRFVGSTMERAKNFIRQQGFGYKFRTLRWDPPSDSFWDESATLRCGDSKEDAKRRCIYFQIEVFELNKDLWG